MTLAARFVDAGAPGRAAHVPLGRGVSWRPFMGGPAGTRKDNFRTKTANAGNTAPPKATRSHQTLELRRSDWGDMPKARTKARRMRLESPKPVDAAM